MLAAYYCQALNKMKKIEKLEFFVLSMYSRKKSRRTNLQVVCLLRGKTI